MSTKHRATAGQMSEDAAMSIARGATAGHIGEELA